MSKKMEGPDGKIIEVDDSMTPQQMADLHHYLQTEQGFMRSIGFGHDTAATIDQGGLGVLQGVASLPGVPFDAVTWALNRVGENTGLWKSRDSSPLGGAMWQGLAEKAGLIPNIHPDGTFSHMVNGAGRGVGGMAAGGGSGLPALYGGAGGGASSALASEIWPKSEVAPVVAGLIGGIAGGYAGITPPKPGPGVSNATLNARVAAGKQTSSMPDTMAEQEAMMSEGGPSGPIRPPTQPASPETQAAGVQAQGILNQLQLQNAVKNATPRKGNEMLQPVKEVTKPTLMDRAAYQTGLANPKTAYEIALHEAIKHVEGKIPGAGAKILSGLAKIAGKATFGIHLGHGLYIYEGLKPILDALRKDPALARSEALDNLETIIRTGEPIPTRGTVVKNTASGLLGQLKGTSK